MTGIAPAGGIESVRIVIPARNEESRLPACLSALDDALDVLAAAFPTVEARAFVAADSCHDRTPDIAHAWPSVTLVQADAAVVGATRDRGIRAALADSPCPRPATWIACTDADTLVPPHWLETQLVHANRGCALLLGTVQLPDATLPGYQYTETHPHVHGANLGVRADAYLAVGGFPPLPEHEDHRLAAAIRAAGLPWHATDTNRVITSGRRAGRTPGGFAATIRSAAARTPSRETPELARCLHP